MKYATQNMFEKKCFVYSFNFPKYVILFFICLSYLIIRIKISSIDYVRYKWEVFDRPEDIWFQQPLPALVFCIRIHNLLKSKWNKIFSKRKLCYTFCILFILIIRNGNLKFCHMYFLFTLKIFSDILISSQCS